MKTTRIILAGVLGGIAMFIWTSIATNVSYWNWYGFPGIYTAAYMVIQIIGFLCVGLAAALVLGKSTATDA